MNLLLDTFLILPQLSPSYPPIFVRNAYKRKWQSIFTGENQNEQAQHLSLAVSADDHGVNHPRIEWTTGPWLMLEDAMQMEYKHCCFGGS